MIRRPPNSPLFPYTTLSRSTAYPDHLARLTLTRPRKRRRRQPRSLGARAQPGRGLRVIHIMYTVWGDHTTYRANGQEVISPTEALDGGGKLPHTRPPDHGGGLRGARQHLGRVRDLRRAATGPRCPAASGARSSDVRDAIHEAPHGGPV